MPNKNPEKKHREHLNVARLHCPFRPWCPPAKRLNAAASAGSGEEYLVVAALAGGGQ
ncbi:hypothetical protein Fmac_032146 [Flemingia macrophylla]|uniref:Uncharacterized protein n=1 Tax=Flemingia macrophylla TaxID=520843 RepID=A0ABD1L428_9FABA